MLLIFWGLDGLKSVISLIDKVGEWPCSIFGHGGGENIQFPASSFIWLLSEEKAWVKKELENDLK